MTAAEKEYGGALYALAAEEHCEDAVLEGLTLAADAFRETPGYLKLVQNLEEGIVFSRDGDTIWQCANCGHIVIGKKAPEVCPVCAHPQAYFQIKAENY